MGRNLCVKYGTDKAAILAKLEPLRKTQGVSSLFDIKRYQDDYYNYATLFDGSDMHKYVTWSCEDGLESVVGLRQGHAAIHICIMN